MNWIMGNSGSLDGSCVCIDICYFPRDITSGQSLEDVDISVHCDIAIFEWLMEWINREEAARQKRLLQDDGDDDEDDFEEEVEDEAESQH